MKSDERACFWAGQTEIKRIAGIAEALLEKLPDYFDEATRPLDK